MCEREVIQNPPHPVFINLLWGFSMLHYHTVCRCLKKKKKETEDKFIMIILKVDITNIYFDKSVVMLEIPVNLNETSENNRKLQLSFHKI